MRFTFNRGVILACCIFSFISSESLAGDADSTYGYLKVFSNTTESFFIVIDNDFDNPARLFSGDSVKVSTGLRHFRFVRRNVMDQTLRKEIEVGETQVWQIISPLLSTAYDIARFSSYPRIYWGFPKMVITSKDAVISYNGVQTDQFFIGLEARQSGMVSASNGNHTLTPRRISASPSNNTFDVTYLYIQPHRGTVYRYSALPGAAQFYKQQPIKGAAFSTLTAGSLGFFIYTSVEYSKSYREYRNLHKVYMGIRDHRNAYLVGEDVERAYSRSRDLAIKRNYALVALTSLYVLNLIDAFIPPRTGYRSERVEFNPYLETDGVLVSPGVRISASF